MVPQFNSRICNVLVRIRIRNPNPDPQGFGSGPGSAWIRINLSCWIRTAYKLRMRIRIQEGKNDPKKLKKGQNLHLLKCWMFAFEG